MSASVFLIPTIKEYDFASSLREVIESEIAYISEAYIESNDGTNEDLTGRSEPESVGYGVQVELFDDRVRDGIHLDLTLRANLIGLEFNSTDIDEELEDESTSFNHVCPEYWLYGNLSKYENGRQEWLYMDFPNRTYLKSASFGIGWNPVEEWMAEGKLHDACFMGNLPMLQRAWNELYVRSGSNTSSGFFELFNLFLETAPFEGFDITGLDFFMNVLLEFGLAGQIEIDGVSVWYIDGISVTSFLQNPSGFILTCFGLPSGDFDFSSVFSALDGFSLPGISALELSNLNGLNVLNFDLSPFLDTGSFCLSLRQDGHCGIAWGGWSLGEGLTLNLNAGISCESGRFAPSLSFDFEFGDVSWGPMQHGSFSLLWDWDSGSSQSYIDFSLNLPGLTEFVYYNPSLNSFSLQSFSGKFNLFSTLPDFEIDLFDVLKQIGPFFCLDSVMRSFVNEFLIDRLSFNFGSMPNLSWLLEQFGFLYSPDGGNSLRCKSFLPYWTNPLSMFSLPQGLTLPSFELFPGLPLNFNPVWELGNLSGLGIDFGEDAGGVPNNWNLSWNGFSLSLSPSINIDFNGTFSFSGTSVSLSFSPTQIFSNLGLTIPDIITDLSWSDITLDFSITSGDGIEISLDIDGQSIDLYPSLGNIMGLFSGLYENSLNTVFSWALDIILQRFELLNIPWVNALLGWFESVGTAGSGSRFNFPDDWTLSFNPTFFATVVLPVLHSAFGLTLSSIESCFILNATSGNDAKICIGIVDNGSDGDTLDIWFDSGSMVQVNSNQLNIEARVKMRWTSDGFEPEFLLNAAFENSLGTVMDYDLVPSLTLRLDGGANPEFSVSSSNQQIPSPGLSYNSGIALVYANHSWEVYHPDLTTAAITLAEQALSFLLNSPRGQSILTRDIIWGLKIQDLLDSFGFIDIESSPYSWDMNPTAYSQADSKWKWACNCVLDLFNGFEKEVSIAGVSFTISIVKYGPESQYRITFRPSESIVISSGEYLVEMIQQSTEDLRAWTNPEIVPGLSIALGPGSPDGSYSFSMGLNGIGVRVQRNDKAPLMDGFLLLNTVTSLIAFDLQTQPTNQYQYGIQLQLDNFGVGLGSNGGSEGGNTMAAGLLSGGEGNERIRPEFDICLWFYQGTSFDWGISVDGKLEHWFPINKQFGPIKIAQIGVLLEVSDEGWSESSLSLMIDGEAELAGFLCQVDDLSVTIPLNGFMDTSTWTYDLSGLAISYKGPSFSIAGALRKAQYSNYIEYQGLCEIKTSSMAISAIGAFGRVPDGKSSYATCFVIAALDYPLGGIPEFFVTGLLGGLGLNRDLILPDISKLPESLFMQAMGGSLSDDPMGALQAIRGELPAKKDSLWFALGLKFTTYQIIETKAVLYMVLSDSTTIGLMGLSSLSLPSKKFNVGYVELAFNASFDTGEGILKVQAQLTDASYLFDKNCRLTGGFALVSWFKRGEFLLSLGGYHPKFKAPNYYPTVPRLGFNWKPISKLTIKGEAYFTVCSSAVMLGGSYAAIFKAGRLSASFNAGVDVLVVFDPFFYSFKVYISLSVRYKTWLKTFKASLGAHLTIEGPKMRGKARIELAFISFTVKFGASSSQPFKALPFPEFVNKHVLQLPENAHQGGINSVFNQRFANLVVTNGLLRSAGGDASTGTQIDPFVVGSEFDIAMSCIFPSSEVGMRYSTDATTNDYYNDKHSDEIDIAPCGIENGIDSKFTTTVSSIAGETIEMKGLSHQSIHTNFPETIWRCELDDAKRPKVKSTPGEGQPSFLTGLNLVARSYPIPGQWLGTIAMNQVDSTLFRYNLPLIKYSAMRSQSSAKSKAESIKDIAEKGNRLTNQVASREDIFQIYSLSRDVEKKQKEAHVRAFGTSNRHSFSGIKKMDDQLRTKTIEQAKTRGRQFS